jgi:Na+/H+-translocating membrane pyrophosphatase
METIVLPLFVLLALGAGFAFVWGAPIFGIPLLVLALAAGGAWMFTRRAAQAGDVRQELDHAKAEHFEPTARDKETLTHR